jgi:ATP-dependent exoDNAse (exonuclease V) beta subunit
VRTSSRFFRGYIDCLYQDTRGGWHLIDYKTDTVSPDEVAQKAQQYEMQIGLYALAAEKALGDRLAEVVLYFLKPGQEYPLVCASPRKTAHFPRRTGHFSDQ